MIFGWQGMDLTKELRSQIGFETLKDKKLQNQTFGF
jgi:hypothetical protein